VKKGNTAIPQVRVKWQGLSEEATSWEDWNVLVEKFPDEASCGQVVI
jgi:hypothetical protein